MADLFDKFTSKVVFHTDEKSKRVLCVLKTAVHVLEVLCTTIVALHLTVDTHQTKYSVLIKEPDNIFVNKYLFRCSKVNIMYLKFLGEAATLSHCCLVGS